MLPRLLSIALFLSLFVATANAQIIFDKPKATAPAKTPVTKPAAKPKSRPAVVAPRPTAPVEQPARGAYAYLLVTSDLEVRVTVNGEHATVIKPTDDIKKVPLEQGLNLVRVQPIDGGSDGYTERIEATSRGNRELSIRLGSTRQGKRPLATPQQTPAKSPTDANMVRVEGGSFHMGSNTNDYEKPVHTVRVNSFYMSKYEVTVAQFEQFITATSYQTDADKEGYSYVLTDKFEKKNGVNWRCDVSGTPRSRSEYSHPVIHVSWNDAVAYCAWLSRSTGKGYRLPTEAEWEFAARGGTQSRGYTYAGSDDLGSVGWYSDNSGKTTHAVGQKSANELGIYDMSGNVLEWCADWYTSDYYASSPSDNPTGSSTGTFRVLRGGGWYDTPARCRSADRDNGTPSHRINIIGFRVVSQSQ